MEVCRACNGSGQKLIAIPVVCLHCHGMRRGIDGRLCGECRGTGQSKRYESHPCGTCGGTGSVMKRR